MMNSRKGILFKESQIGGVVMSQLKNVLFILAVRSHVFCTYIGR